MKTIFPHNIVMPPSCISRLVYITSALGKQVGEVNTLRRISSETEERHYSHRLFLNLRVLPESRYLYTDASLCYSS